MKLVLRSKDNMLDDKFIKYVIRKFPQYLWSTQNIRKVKKVDKYLQQNIFTGRRKYTTKQAISIVLRNIVYETDGKTATIQISNTAVFPFYTIKVVDIAKLINDGNLDISGTHIFTDMFKKVRDNILLIRNNYEMGLL